jgi:hypothetical protein
MKKFLMLVLCLAVVLAAIPVSAVGEEPVQTPTVRPVYKDSHGGDLLVQAQALEGHPDNYEIVMNDNVVGNLLEGLNDGTGNVNQEGGYNLQLEIIEGYAAKYLLTTTEPDFSTVNLDEWSDATGTSISVGDITEDSFLYVVFVEDQNQGGDNPPAPGDDQQPETYRVIVEVRGRGTVYGQLQGDEPGNYLLTVANTGDSPVEDEIILNTGSPSLNLTWAGDVGYAMSSTYQVVRPADGSTDPVTENVPGGGGIFVNAEIDGVAEDTRVIITFTQGGEPGPGDPGKPGPGEPGEPGEPGPGPEPQPLSPFDLTINKPENGTVYFFDPDPEVGLVPLTAANLELEQLTETFTVFLKPDVGYKVASVQEQMFGTSKREDCSYLLSYATNVSIGDDQGLIAARLDFWNDTEVFFEFSPVAATDMTEIQLAILSSDNIDDTAAKRAIRRELGYYKFDVPEANITVGSVVEHTSDNGVSYKTRTFTVMGYTSTVYIVDHVSNGIFISDGTYSDGTTGRKIYIYEADDLSMALWGNQNFSVQSITEGTLDLFGPFNLGYIGTFSPDTEDALSLSGNYNYRMDINRYFGRVALHIGNGAVEDLLDMRGVEVNWYMMTLIQEDALAVQINTGSAIGGFQGAHSLDLDNVSDLSTGDAQINMFFGNDTVFVEKPENEAGDIQSMTTPEIDHPGYTIRMVNGSIEVFFKSNFYDRLTIPITIIRSDGTTVIRNLTVIRTGIEFEHFISSRSDPNSSTANVGHGTQRGSEINLRGDDSYFVVASYLIPDFGNTLPYGLLVTRTYDDGTTETEIVRNPIDSPPAFFNAIGYEDGIYYYNSGLPEDGSDPIETNANVADYMVFAGDENGRVPETINVLVLKADPASVTDGSFGGFSFGSGSGVEWDRPN